MTPLLGRAKFVAGTNVHSEPNSYSGDVVSEHCRKMGLDSQGFYTARDALDHIFNNFPPGIVLACGSLYLAGEILFANQFTRN